MFTWWCRALDPDPVLPGPVGAAWADAIGAVTAAGQAFMMRFRVVEVPLWQVAVAGLRGEAAGPGLARTERRELINTSCP